MQRGLVSGSLLTVRAARGLRKERYGHINEGVRGWVFGDGVCCDRAWTTANAAGIVVTCAPLTDARNRPRKLSSFSTTRSLKGLRAEAGCADS